MSEDQRTAAEIKSHIELSSNKESKPDTNSTEIITEPSTDSVGLQDQTKIDKDERIEGEQSGTAEDPRQSKEPKLVSSDGINHEKADNSKKSKKKREKLRSSQNEITSPEKSKKTGRRTKKRDKPENLNDISPTKKEKGNDQQKPVASVSQGVPVTVEDRSSLVSSSENVLALSSEIEKKEWNQEQIETPLSPKSSVSPTLSRNQAIIKFSGYLMRFEKDKKVYQRVWVVLKDQMLNFYANELVKFRYLQLY